MTTTAGYCPESRIYRSLRPAVALPSMSLPMSTTSYCFSLLPTPLPTNPFLVLASSHTPAVSYPSLLSLTRSLSISLLPLLSPGDVAFILSPTDLHVPILYFSLFSLGVIVSPADPIGSLSEIEHQCNLVQPKIVFTHSSAADKVPSRYKTIILDSPEFNALLSKSNDHKAELPIVKQSDPATILFSSGTTGKVKGAVLTHRSFIASIAAYYEEKVQREKPLVALFDMSLFGSLGFFTLFRAAALAETVVLIGGVEMGVVLKAVEEHRVTYVWVRSSLVVAMAKSEEIGRYDLSSLEVVVTGGAPLRKEAEERFVRRLPHVKFCQSYGMTEAGRISGVNDYESTLLGSVGLLRPNMEAKIVDTNSGECLAPVQAGELWLRGPSIMSGYIGNDEATASTLDSDGWLKTGDLCYFDRSGHLFIEDRLKELIKYKEDQVAPAELENILQSHPEIVDAAVVPYPNEEAGEIPMAFVVKQPESNLNEEQVMAFVEKQVAPYKKVRRVAFVSSIPKSVAGKILRRELVNQAVASLTSKV